MAKVDGSLGSLVQGVSQQPSRARLPGQSEEQLNVRNDEVFGMSRRPSTTVVTSGTGFAPFNGERITENGTFRMNTELLPYNVRIVNGSGQPQMRIVKPDGFKLVSMPAETVPYMRADPADHPYANRLIFKEMDDRVFVLNTGVKVKKLPDLPTSSTRNATVVYCRGGKYAVGYTIRFKFGGNEHQVTYSTPDGSDTSHTPKGQVKYIIRQLYNLCRLAKTGTAGTSATSPKVVDVNDSDWVPDPGEFYMSTGAQAALVAAFDIYMVGGHIIFSPKVSSLSYTITATETTNSELLVDVRDEIRDVGRLPTRAPVGMVVKITGSHRAEDDYFLKWTVKDAALDGIEDLKGVWEECTAPNEPYKLDPATMPHELYVNASGQYAIRALEWAERAAGSDLSNPFPEFVGRTIQDIADFQGRSVVLHGNTISMSRTDAYADWFKQTASTKLATDPIHMRSTATDGDSQLIYAVPFNRDLVLFGTNNAQFMINGRRTITGDNASMVLTSEFETDLKSRPVAIGDSILFLSWTGKFTHVHEMFLQGDQNNHARRTVTDHVPRYIPGRATVFDANDGANTAVIVTDADPKTMFVYEFLWIDQRRVQSAWSKWNFDADVRFARIERGALSMTFGTAQNRFLHTSMVLYRRDAEGLNFPLHVDYATTHTLTDTDTINASASGNSPTVADTVAIALTGSSVHGMPLPIESVTLGSDDTYVIKLKKKYTGKVLVGTKFKTRLIPTMPVLRDSDGVAITGAELSVSEFNVTFNQTGPFKMIRQCSYEQPADYWTSEYSGRTLGDPDFKLGTAPIDSDVFDFPFDDLTTTSKLVIECDTHLPMTLTEIEWNGSVRNRSRRLTNGG